MSRINSSERVLVMGAAGRFGFAAAEAFRDAGWGVTSLVRPGRAAAAPPGTEIIEVASREAAAEAAQGCTLVVNALNPLISQWQKALPLAYSGIDAAEAAGATLLFPGNIYNYGAKMPPMLDETTPMLPTNPKGSMRVEMEHRMREASDRGVRVIVLRAGDFFGSGIGSWLDLVIAKNLHKGKITYPGPPDVMHEWAYLPDLAATAVKLAAVRDTLAPFETFQFPGHSMTGRQLVDTIEAVTQRQFKVEQMSWWLVKSIGRLLPIGRDLAEIEYLWRTPHRLVGDKLKGVIGDIPHTPRKEAIATALRALGYRG